MKTDMGPYLSTTKLLPRSNDESHSINGVASDKLSADINHETALARNRGEHEIRPAYPSERQS